MLKNIFIDTPVEESYTDEILKTIKKFSEKCKSLSETHLKISKVLYQKHVLFSLPQILIPISMIFVSQTLYDDDLNRSLSGIAFLVSGVSSGLHQFFEFGKLSQKHETASDRYLEVITLIDFDLSRDESFRIPADVMLERLKVQIKYLNLYSPSIENSCVSECCK